MPIVALLQKAAFDPETTHILTTAFDKAWDKFKSSGSPLADDACAPSTRALLAKQIIEIAQRGERNIDRLVENGVAYLQEVRHFQVRYKVHELISARLKIEKQKKQSAAADHLTDNIRHCEGGFLKRLFT
jgi:hypothetical protein